MFPLVKLLKIALPVATVTSATIATTFLVSLSKKDPKKKEKDIDEQLNDFKKPSEDFKDKKMYYSKDSNQKNLVALDKELPPDLVEKLEKQIQNLEGQGETAPTEEEIDKLLSNFAPKSVPKGDEETSDINDSKEDEKNKINGVPQSDAPLELVSKNQPAPKDTTKEGVEDDSKNSNPDESGLDNSGGESGEDQKEMKGNSDVSAIDEPTAGPQESNTVTSDQQVNEPVNDVVDPASEEGSSLRDQQDSDLDVSQPGMTDENKDFDGLNKLSTSSSGEPEQAGLNNEDPSAQNQMSEVSHGSPVTENGPGTDSVGGDMTPEKLRELLDIQNQAEDLLGSLGQMLKIS